TKTKKAIHIKPDYVEAYNNMGNVLKSQRKVAEAIEAFKNALELKSDYADALHNMGQTFLAIKNFCEGFKLSAWRWKTKKFWGRFLTSAKPVWGGETNQRLLVWGEQGIGDEIMFASMIPELCEAQSKIIVQCDKRLIPLFQRSFCDKISFYSNDKRVCEDDYDYHIPMGSLPLFFRKSLGDFKIASHGFLRCDKKLAQNIRNQILLGRNKKLVGISWNTVSTSAHAKARNFSLRDLVLALDNERTQLVSLQYGDVSAEIEAVKKDLDIEIVQYSSVDNMRDIDGLASIIMACDQVVTIDNCTVHLAGALGVKTDLLLPRTCDWRWGLDCDDSYWYESVKLHRQSKNANWNMRISQFTAQ
ncbi:MAG: tetratricopeptide repeat protein, partial [Alphaproteobacteria bacterium]